jgi:RNA polymerase sigma factor (TIGR02999 family)
MSDVTLILSQLSAGDSAAAEKLLVLVYDELRRIAAVRLAEEKPGQTLQATALVHEAWLRLVGENVVIQFESRKHFLTVAAEAMRRILVDRARAKLTAKRGGGGDRVGINLDLLPDAGADRLETTIAISDALDVLASLDPAAAELLKLRYFAGLTLDDAAQAVGISRTTAYEHWRFAKAWLQKQLS